MKDTAIHWANCMRTGRIPTDDAWLAFQTTIWKTLPYPLPALNILMADCEQIMVPILQYLLPAAGVCKKFPCTLVFSSEQYMGLGAKHLHTSHTSQEILRIKDIPSHVYQRSNTGKLYRVLEFLLLERGLGTELHLLQHETLQLLATDSLAKSTCQFLFQHNLELCHDIIISILYRSETSYLCWFFYAFLLYNTSLRHWTIVVGIYRCSMYLKLALGMIGYHRGCLDRKKIWCSLKNEVIAWITMTLGQGMSNLARFYKEIFTSPSA